MIVKFYDGNQGQELQIITVQHDRDRIRLETELFLLERDRINQKTIDDNNFYWMIFCAYAITLICVVFLCSLVSDTFCATFNFMFTLVGL